MGFYGKDLIGEGAEWLVAEGRINYFVSTLGGQSGAPIFLGEDCIGIHVMGNPNGFNSGRLLTLDLLKQVLEWIKELKADNFKVNLRYKC